MKVPILLLTAGFFQLSSNEINVMEGAVLKYCAWCGKYQGSVKAEGYQIRKNLCEIDTTTICPTCFMRLVKDIPEGQRLQA